MIRVVCAIITRNAEILCVKRGKVIHEPYLWEFPGGKIQQGETEQEALVREVMEELNLKVIPQMRLKPVRHEYPEKSIELIPYFCKTNGDAPPILTEHLDFKWLKPNQLHELNWCPADIPITYEVSRWFSV
ncbi:MAG: (deoxy)nucleoside triphosphate pyrophosphohydrolase [Cyclobacteriaceae bacterium]|nr:(deoxy)nucleoside triphosphate pyrophosphohydrolase [Cyclobacteriaceae bacterium]